MALFSFFSERHFLLIAVGDGVLLVNQYQSPVILRELIDLVLIRRFLPFLFSGSLSRRKSVLIIIEDVRGAVPRDNVHAVRRIQQFIPFHQNVIILEKLNVFQINLLLFRQHNVLRLIGDRVPLVRVLTAAHKRRERKAAIDNGKQEHNSKRRKSFPISFQICRHMEKKHSHCHHGNDTETTDNILFSYFQQFLAKALLG